MGLQRRAVIIDPIQHDGRPREDPAGRCVLAFRQDMMNQASVYTSVAVLERVSVDKAKCGSRRLQDGSEPVIPHSVIGSQQQETGGGQQLYRHRTARPSPGTDSRTYLSGSKDQTPGTKVQIEQMSSIADAEVKESHIISRSKPKHNKHGK